MPTIQVNGVSLHYEEHGSGAETIVFVHGLLMNHHMFDAQFSNNNRTGTVSAAMAVIKREGVYQHLGEINTPTLIIVGDQDVATTPVKARRMHGAIKDSKLLIIPGAGHSSSIETPDEVTRALGEFMHGCADI